MIFEMYILSERKLKKGDKGFFSKRVVYSSMYGAKVVVLTHGIIGT